jgi:hypothetical protein
MEMNFDQLIYIVQENLNNKREELTSSYARACMLLDGKHNQQTLPECINACRTFVDAMEQYRSIHKIFNCPVVSWEREGQIEDMASWGNV